MAYTNAKHYHDNEVKVRLTDDSHEALIKAAKGRPPAVVARELLEEGLARLEALNHSKAVA